MPSTAGAAPYMPLPGNASLEQTLLTLTNGARADAGLAALAPDEALAQAARHHAAEMAELSYFSHTSPVSENATLGRRVARSGSFVRTLGENLALVGATDTAQASVSGWLESPGHRATLLHPGFTHVGFGSAPYPDGRVAVAQVFGYQPAGLQRVRLASVLTVVPLLSTTVSLAAPGKVAIFYGDASSPPQTLSAGQHTLSVPLSKAPALPLPVQLGLRSGASDSFILQDDGWLGADGWRRSGEVSGAQGQLLAVGVDEQPARVFELRLDFATVPTRPLSAWQGETLLPLRTDGTRVTLALSATHGDLPLHIGEAQADGRYRVVYSLLPSTTGIPAVSPTGK